MTFFNEKAGREQRSKQIRRCGRFFAEYFPARGKQTRRLHLCSGRRPSPRPHYVCHQQRQKRGAGIDGGAGTGKILIMMFRRHGVKG